NSEPAAPNRFRLLLMALMGSLGLAGGAVVLAERVDTSFHTVDDLRAFSPVPVLVSIPRIVTRTDRRRRAWHMRLAASAALIGLVVISGLAYFAASGNEQLVSLLGRSSGSWGPWRVPDLLRPRGETSQRGPRCQIPLPDA